jgi:hypothetical protein
MKGVICASVLIFTSGAAWAACDITLNPGENVSSAVAAAAPGSTVCLNPGNHNALNLNGVVKNPRVSVQSASAKGAQISFSLQGGTNGINLNSLTLTSGRIAGATTKNITVSHSDFKAINGGDGKIVLDGLVNSNVLLDGNTHNNINVSGQGVAGRISLPYGSASHSGVTVQNSVLDGGCADGIQSGVGLNIYNNRFLNMRVGNCANDPHTDAVQFVFHSGAGPHIRGNYFYNNEQVLTAFDRVANAVIEDNIFEAGAAGRPWQIEWYSDTNSIIRHNTLLYNAKCAYNAVCGQIYLGRKSADPAGRGTVVVDNIATMISVNDGSAVAERHHNLVRSGAAAGEIAGSPTYAGGASPTTWEGFRLAAGSLGVKAATDGTDIGSRLFGSSTVTPPPPPPPPPPPVTDPDPPVPPPATEAVSLFTNQTPKLDNQSDGARVNYELGMRFISSKAGRITAIRYYKASKESGKHTGRIFGPSGQIAQVTFKNETAGAGWQMQKLAAPIAIKANTEYVVCFNPGLTYYVATVNGFASPVANGVLKSAAGNNGVFGPVGARPRSSWQNSNYFRDVVFVPSP